MKRFIAFVSFALLSGFLSACSSNSHSIPQPTQTAPPAPPQAPPHTKPKDVEAGVMTISPGSLTFASASASSQTITITVSEGDKIQASSSDAGIAQVSPTDTVHVAAKHSVTFTVSPRSIGSTTIQFVDKKGTGVIPVTVSGHALYVTNEASNTVSVVDAQSYAITATIGVGSEPDGVAVSAPLMTAYVANVFSNSVSVINTATNTVTGTISNINCPSAVAISPSTQFLYVASRGGSSGCIDSVPGNVYIVSTASNAIVNSVSVGVRPTSIVFSPSGSTAYVLNNSNNIQAIDTGTLAVSAPIAIGCGGNTVTIDPAGAFLYATGSFSCGVDVVSTSSNSQVQTIGINGQGNDIVIAGTAKAYLADSTTNNVYVIDRNTNQVISGISTPLAPAGETVNGDGSMVYVTCGTANQGVAINTQTDTVVATFSLPGAPAEIAFL